MSKSKPNLAVITASLGGFDKEMDHVPQSQPHDYYTFTDENFPPRSKSMTPRLQAKIPKLFGWQMVPGYDYYFWIDGNLTLIHPDSLKYFYDNLKDSDIVVFKHPRRDSVRWEMRYLYRGLKQGSRYMSGRYAGEWLKEQYDEIHADKDFVDDMLVNGGAFMYRDTPEIRKMMKEWWYHVSRYNVQDQISFAYALKKSGVRVNVRPDNLYHNTLYLSHQGHIHHY